MPTYEYECRACRHGFEMFQSMSEDPVKVCPSCGGEVRRIIGGGSGIIFKGSGFYVTDSKKSGSVSSPASSGTKKKTSAPACENCPKKESKEPA